ncbi:DNA repair protein RadC [Oscillochloris sp. ZM17-4]|uniref:RadC family protein n=1 Tax=Oscillochloris sp. ZM17-4 TaxID=2866714 RepID=UPI001C72FBD5|nr:DNA repair protein RadC [Oscillochloris sp. ZM17-4]MBX0330017.1 DNA repair protein RadC [Oscillochloris sp. ZM17-4]
MPRYVRELPPAEQPIYRLTAAGPAALSDAELIAILTNLSDLSVAQRLLDHFGTLANIAGADPREIRHVATGIGRSRAAQLGAAFELARRLFAASQDTRPQIRSPADANTLLRAAIGGELQEHLVVLCLDTKNRVMKLHTVYIGSVNAAAIRVGEIFREAIRLNATAIIIGHNHPSNDPSPSPEDVLVTRQIVDAGVLLDIPLLDHLVVCQSRYVSMKERGLGFPN